MLFFIDESWQSTADKKHKVGVLAAVQIKSHDFNDCSRQMYYLKVKHLGAQSGSLELKGRHNLRAYLFDLESKGIISRELNVVRAVFDYMKTMGTQLFASVVFEEKELDLACADANQLDRPFFFLFERIDLFMKENYPGMMAKLVFDDRGIQANGNISASVSNFFHKCEAGKRFNNIIKVPFFGISTENIGIQMADLVAYTLGCRFTGDRRQQEFFTKAKGLEFMSRQKNERMYPLRGFKVIKKKEAGDLFNPGRVNSI